MIYRVKKEYDMEDVLSLFEPLIRRWFTERFKTLTPPQSHSIPLIEEGKNLLIASPTGSGKTLAAFITTLDKLIRLGRAQELENKVYCLYISPLKALANDIERNLTIPLEEINYIAEEEGVDLPEIRVGVRTGDTSAYEKQKMSKVVPHILITTPETLGIVLSTSKFRKVLSQIELVIVDEIHELCSSKRGVHLSLCLERLQHQVGEREFNRIGLSATQSPMDLIAKFLVGYDGKKQRDCHIFEASATKTMELSLLSPVEDLNTTPYEIIHEKMYENLERLIKENRSTIVFTNTRSGTESIAYRLKEKGLSQIAAHHGSLSRSTRLDVEEQLKEGKLKATITSTSLELGIDIGYIDLVCQLGSPKSIAKGLQRIGRAGHALHDISRGVFLINDRDDLVECAVLLDRARAGQIDRIQVPLNSLDVLAQNLVGMSLEQRWDLKDALKVIRRSYCFHTLSQKSFLNVLNYIAGQGESSYFGIYGKLWYDKKENMFGLKKGGRLIYNLNSGTIPQEANFAVFKPDSNTWLGNLSEKFVERLSKNDVFVLGGKSYRFLQVQGTRVEVSEAPGRNPTIPSWAGELLPRSFDLSREIGNFRKEVAKRLEEGLPEEEILSWLKERYLLDDNCAKNIVAYFSEQRGMVPVIPTSDLILIEGYLDDRSTRNVIFHNTVGRKVNEALAKSYAYALGRKYGCSVRTSVTDDSFMLTFNMQVPLEGLADLVTSEELPRILKSAIRGSELFRQRFRHCAMRGFAILRNYRGIEISIKKQHQRARKLIQLMEGRDDFPLIEEVYNEIQGEVFDVEHAQEVLRLMEMGSIRVHYHPFSAIPSPFAHGVVLTGISDIVLLEDKFALLRKLHMEVLRRVLPQDELFKPKFEVESIIEHFSNKVTSVAKKSDLLALFDLFGPLDLPFGKRWKKALPEGMHLPPDEDIIGWFIDLLNDGELSSVWLKGRKWIREGEMPFYHAVYGKKIEMNSKGEDLLESIRNNEMNLPPRGKVATRLNDLERSNIIRCSKVDVDGKVSEYSVNQDAFSSMGSQDETFHTSLPKMISRFLGWAGPSTSDEVSFYMDLQHDIIDHHLKDLTDRGTLISGSLVIGKDIPQYMLAIDAARLESSIEGVPILDVDTARMYIHRKLLIPQKSPIAYINNVGSVSGPFEVALRCESLTPSKWSRLITSGQIQRGSFDGESLTWSTREMLPLWIKSKLRAPATGLEGELLHLIRTTPGMTKTSLATRIGINSSALTEDLDGLVRQLLVFQEIWGMTIQKRAIRYQPAPDLEFQTWALTELLLRIIKTFGPIGVKDIVRIGGFDLELLGDALSTLSDEGRIVKIFLATPQIEETFISSEEFEGLGTESGLSTLSDLGKKGMTPQLEDRVLILSRNDPICRRFKKEIQVQQFYGSNYLIVHRGRLKGGLEFSEEEGFIHVTDLMLDDLYLDIFGKTLEGLISMLEYTSKGGSDTLRIERLWGVQVDELPEPRKTAFYEHGLSAVGGSFIHGPIIPKTYSFEEMFQYILYCQHINPESQMGEPIEVVEALGTISSNDEIALRMKRRFIGLVNLQKAHDLLMLPLGSGKRIWTTMRIGSYYQIARGFPQNREMIEVLEKIPDEYSISPSDLQQRVDHHEEDFNRILKTLHEGVFIARDGFRNIVKVHPLGISRKEALRRLVHTMVSNMGIMNFTQLRGAFYSTVSNDTLFQILKELVDKGDLVKGFLIEDDPRLYWARADITNLMGKYQMEGGWVLSPGDRLTSHLSQKIKEKFGPGKRFVIFDGQEMVGAFNGRTRGTAILAKKFIGNREHKRIAEGFFAKQRMEVIWEDEQGATDDFFETRDAFWEEGI